MKKRTPASPSTTPSSAIPSPASPTGATAAPGPLAPGQRWSRGRKIDVVMRMFRGESIDSLSRELGVEAHKLTKWRESALDGITQGLRGDDDPEGVELARAKKAISELAMQVELLKELDRRGRGPFRGGRSSK